MLLLAFYVGVMFLVVAICFHLRLQKSVDLPRANIIKLVTIEIHFKAENNDLLSKPRLPAKISCGVYRIWLVLGKGLLSIKPFSIVLSAKQLNQTEPSSQNGQCSEM